MFERYSTPFRRAPFSPRVFLRGEKVPKADERGLYEMLEHAAVVMRLVKMLFFLDASYRRATLPLIRRSLP